MFCFTKKNLTTFPGQSKIVTLKQKSKNLNLCRKVQKAVKTNWKSKNIKKKKKLCHPLSLCN